MVGWKLYDLAYELDLSSELRVFQSGMPFADLYALYCAADAYLSCSKGEGLGIPVMESMAIGIPVVANTTGALTELLQMIEDGW
jgi:glycosyltransferase involved in cell wall biosynthesis